MLILEGDPVPVYSLAFSPDGLLAAAFRSGRVTCWDAATAPVRTVDAPSDSNRMATAVDFSATGDRIAFAIGPGWWDEPVPSVPKSLNLHTASGDRHGASVTAVRFLDVKTVAVGTGDRSKSMAGAFELWDLPTGKPRRPTFHEPHGVRSIAAHPPSKTVAWSNASRRISVWDVTKSAPVHFNLTHSSPAVAFRPDGKELVAAVDYTVRVFELARRFERLNLKGHRGQVTSVAVTPDGRTIVSGSWDGTVKLWDAETGTETATFQWPTGKVYAVACAPDGTRMAAAGEKGTIVVWDTE